MSVDPMRLKTLGAVTLGTLTLGACADPVADTDLRPEGDPEVLAVLVFNDTADHVVESATYCKPGDPKRPGLVGIPAYGISPIICPVDGELSGPVTDAWPDEWYLRIMFDELLDPDVETLEPILDSMGNPTENFTGSLERTQPVVLQCQDVAGAFVDVPYDGYYSPAGNRVTWPVGPSLVIQPLAPATVPVESTCRVQLKPDVIKDKDGNPVRGRDTEPFEFKMAPVQVIATSATTINPSVRGMTLTFNVAVAPPAMAGTPPYCADPANPACFSITPAPTTGTQAFALSSARTSLTVSADLLGEQTYELVPPANFTLKDKCGKETAVEGLDEPVEFETNAGRLLSISPGGGSAVAPARKIALSFNQRVDATTLTLGTDFEIDPQPANFAVTGGGNTPTTITLAGDYALGTMYTLTIKDGAKVTDGYGQQEIELDPDTITFRTIGEIQLTGQSPANQARVTIPSSGLIKISLTFNQDIDSATFSAADYTLTRADGSAIPGLMVTEEVAGAVVSVSAPLTEGNYKFTLNAGAALADRLGNAYTQSASRVIEFSVVNPAPSAPFKCLGQP